MLETLIITAACAGVGALVGAAFSCTKFGKEIDQNMEDAWEKHGKETAKLFVELIGKERLTIKDISVKEEGVEL